MEFKFNSETLYYNQLEVENIFQACIKATDENQFNYYLIIRTLLGESSTLEYGPLIDKDTLLPDMTTITFERFETNEKKLKKKIQNFLSSCGKGKNKIVEAEEISFEEALEEGVDLFDYMRGFSKDTNY